MASLHPKPVISGLDDQELLAFKIICCHMTEAFPEGFGMMDYSGQAHAMHDTFMRRAKWDKRKMPTFISLFTALTNKKLFVRKEGAQGLIFIVNPHLECSPEDLFLESL
jgi:hypothetical protein